MTETCALCARPVPAETDLCSKCHDVVADRTAGVLRHHHGAACKCHGFIFDNIRRANRTKPWMLRWQEANRVAEAVREARRGA